MRQTILSSEINPKYLDLIRTGIRMQEIAPHEPDDVLSNNYAKLANELVALGSPFGPRNIQDILIRTGLDLPQVQNLIDQAKMHPL